MVEKKVVATTKTERFPRTKGRILNSRILMSGSDEVSSLQMKPQKERIKKRPQLIIHGERVPSVVQDCLTLAKPVTRLPIKIKYKKTPTRSKCFSFARSLSWKKIQVQSNTKGAEEAAIRKIALQDRISAEKPPINVPKAVPIPKAQAI